MTSNGSAAIHHCGSFQVQNGDHGISLASLRKGDKTFSIDLKDAYFQILIQPESRSYLQFMLGEGSHS